MVSLFHTPAWKDIIYNYIYTQDHIDIYIYIYILDTLSLAFTNKNNITIIIIVIEEKIIASLAGMTDTLQVQETII